MKKKYQDGYEISRRSLLKEHGSPIMLHSVEAGINSETTVFVEDYRDLEKRRRPLKM